MSESETLPMNFGGIDDENYSKLDTAEVLILPVSYEGTVSYGTGTGAGAMAIIDASRNMELYEEETDSEVYKIGIHTLPEFTSRETPELMMSELYSYTKKLLELNKFICMLGGEHSVSAPIIKAHNEKYENLSVIQIDAHADLRDTYDGTPHSHASIMARVVKDLRIPAVQVGIRSISGEEARSLSEGLPTKIFWARDIAGRTDWIDEAIEGLSENVYLTIDIDGLDPSIVPTTGTPEPGGLGWYETLTLIRKLAEKKRVVGMDLVEYSYFENYDSPAFLCSKLVYKSLAYIFDGKTPKVMVAG
ncbi:MAG: agmatinase [Pyrinomonadaceae bacterium]|nr:agmatinase [Acidobacteriota bacterium]MBK7935149.1 agmatinase [Acidobacteriota bacterium]MBP7376189.1 agmatinase [Pyrinomonadaceae bacterium]